MPFAIEPTLRAVESYLQASGLFRGGVMIGEPKAPPKEGLAAAIFMMRVGVAELTLATTIENHVVRVRLYRNILAEPVENGELELAAVLSKIASTLLGDADLGSTIRAIDAGGIYGTPLTAEWGYVDVSGVLYRVVDITLAMTVDDSAAVAP